MGSSDKRRRHRSKEDRRRESSSPHEHEEGRGSRSGGNKLTEEEQRLYDKARAYVEKEGKDRHGSSRRRERRKSDSSEDDDRHNKSSSRRNKGRKRKSSDKYNSSDNDDNDSDVSSRRDRKRHRSSSHRDRKKHHKQKRSRDRDDRHEKSHKKKKSRHRPHDDDDDEKHNKHSSKRHKSSKHQDDSFRQKATKHINTSKLVSLGEIVSAPPQELLDTDTNYFSHNSHLRLYLFRHYGIYFEDLTSEESHDAFKEFVSKYNDGKLETAYYEIKGKLPQEALDQCQRTQHKWNFKTNKVELQSLKIVRDGVKKQTEYDADDKGGVMQRTQTATAVAAAPGPKSVHQSDEHNKKVSYDERRRADKRHRERIKVANEEMFETGKADYGRERMIEKRREQANKIHGASRDRESEAGAELDDKAIYGGEGGGDISYEAALAREKKFRERKEAAKHERNSELLKKEEDKQKKMLEMLGISGLKPGEKIKIAPRQP